MAPSQKSTKKWEIFAGRNKFYCDGYLMTAPNSGVFYFTVVLITGTSGLFFAFDCPFLAERITPAIPIVGGILFVFTMSSLFRTSFSDPGIIPRASQDEAAYIEKQIEVPNSLNSPTYRPPPRTKEVFVKGQTVKLKYCFTCKIFRPPRASHCSLCDNCVDRFDHHCPWVGNCVGKRNYRFFYMFIVSLAFLAVFIFSCTTTHIVLLFKDEDQFFDIVKKTPFSVIIAVICFCSVWSVIGLAGFHTYLTTSDQTTNEDIKGSFTSKGGQQAINPYSQGNICLNCFHILCGPITPSLIDRRGVVTDEYRTQMQPPDKYNSAPVPPLVVMQPGHDTLNKPYSLENETQSSNAGVFRQRSYDNLQNVPIPTNFKYFAPQSKYNTYNNTNNGVGMSESQNQLVPQVSPAILQGGELQAQRFLPQHHQQQQQQLQQQQINININLTLPSHASSTNSLNSCNAPQTQTLLPLQAPSHGNVLAPSAVGAAADSSSSSSSSTTTINSSTTSGTSSLERSNMMLPSGSSSYLNSYDTISDQQQLQYSNSLPHTCPSSPRNRCASPSCSELDPMLQKSKNYHHKSYKLFKKHHHQQQHQQNPVSPQASSFSQFTPTFWSAQSNRSSVVSTGTLASSIGFGSNHGDEYGSASSSYPNYGGTIGGSGGSGGVDGGGGGAGTSSNSPYAQRRGAAAATVVDKQRFSNVYEYKFNNFDLNSIHEDATNET
ncbi:probable serine/threonine-protein kinase DDB_G0277071 isoform X3 [Culex pipiens pallens]|uniref:probable serine/threonine-protein kinase DDB_G0277071 isoform X3 n=1 Tax=Culex pipiens pallens TaxID=42434 RepID=UPI001954B034|nr:probable serine/threonine-protein kinase DDB_G0277071 isoform X3 [Culex pipiens pallens]